MKRGNDFVLGGVVLGVIASLIIGVLFVKQTDIGHRQRRVVARFRDVGNAHVGNAVVIRGVRSGRIQSIELAPDGWVAVRLLLDHDVELPSQPVVLLNESSLFGDWEASIVEVRALPPDEGLRRQVALAAGAPPILPGATLPGFGQLTSVAGQIAGDVANVANRVQTAFDDRAAVELRTSIRGFSDLSSTLSATVRDHARDLDTMSADLRSAVRTLNATAATTHALAARADSAMPAEEMRRIISDVSSASAALRGAATQVEVASRRFSRSQDRLESFLASADSVLAKINNRQGSLGLLVNDPSLYRNSDSLLVLLRDLVADVKANPKRYVSVRIF